MNTFPRPDLRFLSAAALTGLIALAPRLFADANIPGPPLAAEQHIAILNDDPAMLNHGSQGYLGIDIRDIDTDRAAQLKLKDVRGAEIITIDHDAPACKAGLREHDVILAMNNQPVEGEAQLRRMLRETPPGRSVTFLISRDGQQQSISVQLADRAKLDFHPDPMPEPDDSAEFSGSGPTRGNSFLPGIAINPLYTGLDLDMLGPQLASYFGVQDGSGLLVKRVDDNSPGAAAGLRAGDVITKVNGQAVATTGQWLHTLHANRGKPVQLTVVRDHRENTVNMTAGRAKDKGRLDWPDSGGVWFSQELDLGIPPSELARQLSDSFHAGLPPDFDGHFFATPIDPQQLQNEIRKSLESPSIDSDALAKEMQKQGEQMRRQMEQMQQEFQNLQPHEMQ